MWRSALPLVVVAALVGFFWKGLQQDPSRVPSPLIGKPAPKFSLPELRHPDARFSERQMRGHVSLLNVWATWCIACKEEHPTLMQFASRHDIPLYGLDYKDDRAKAMNWLDKHGDPYHKVAFDHLGDVAINWGVYGAPETFLIDAHGVIRHKYIGPLTPELIRNDLLPRVAKLRAEMQ